jgi:hypothetical protein
MTTTTNKLTRERINAARVTRVAARAVREIMQETGWPYSKALDYTIRAGATAMFAEPLRCDWGQVYAAAVAAHRAEKAGAK